MWRAAMLVLMLWMLGFTVVPGARGAVVRTFTIQEPFGMAWEPEPVSYAVEFPRGAVSCDGIRLRDGQGRTVPAQLTDVTRWPGSTSVKTARLRFLASLQPDTTATWTLDAGTRRIPSPKTDLALCESGDTVDLLAASTGIRVLAGHKTFPQPVTGDRIPAPIQAIRLHNGQWIGKGWWQTDIGCLGYAASVTERGPILARVVITYWFEHGRTYQATVELAAGSDTAVVNEAFDLSEGRTYAMPEMPGARPGARFGYVRPTFASADQAMQWDWWGGVNGAAVTPSAWYLSVYNGLRPDSLDWSGRMSTGAVKEGPGGLAYGQDGRVIGVNGFMQWGTAECTALGIYNSRGSADQVTVLGLLPGRWQHPNVVPTPISTLTQWTQTANIWLDRTTAPDLRLRFPATLGKRVFGIGLMTRTAARDAKGNPLPSTPMVYRQIRMGVHPLDEVKDWVLDYAEPARYPRLLVEPGDLATLVRRGKGRILTTSPLFAGVYFNDAGPQTGRALVETMVRELRAACRQVMVEPWDHNSFAMNLPRYAIGADVALGVPECTSEQARQIRRCVAALVYRAMSPDYVPPREAGFAWGSANMGAALRCRGAMMMALLPHHPVGPAWRDTIARFVQGYARSQLSQSGASLEIGAYGAMAIEFTCITPVLLERAGTPIDWKELLPRLRAAARFRLSYLVPPDLRGGGLRFPSPIGDSPYEGEGALPFLYYALAGRDPALAGQLLWGMNRTLGSLDSFGVSPALLVDPDAKETPPQLASTAFPGSGVIMRNGFPANNETYLNVNAGGFSVGHGHNDRGAFIFYAMGAPLMLDFASQYVPPMPAAWQHNGTITFDHDESAQGPDGKATRPFTCLEPAWDPDAHDLDQVFGKIALFRTTPQADLAVITRRFNYLQRVEYRTEDAHGRFQAAEDRKDVWPDPPFGWTRRMLLVKSTDPLVPDYVVLRDDLPGNTKLTPSLNLLCLATGAKITGQQVIWTGQHGVDLDGYVAEPSRFDPVLHRVGHDSGRAMAPHYEKAFGKPFREEQTLVRVPGAPGAGFFVVLVPRRHGRPMPRFETVAGGNAVRVTFPNRVDTIVLPAKPGAMDVEGVRTTGSAILITQQAGKTVVTPLDAAP